MKLKYFDLARKLSVKSTHHQHKLGCVIVKKNKIVGVGFNEVKTHTQSPHPYKMLHAEISALLWNSYKDLEGSEAYVYRERKDGKLALAKPCSACESALRVAKIKKVYYSSETGYQEINYV